MLSKVAFARRLPLSILITFAIGCVGGVGIALAEDRDAAKTDNHFVRHVVPFLQQFCTDCHSGEGAEGGVALDRFETSANVQEEYELWEKLFRLIEQNQMPPADAEQPTAEETIAILAAIEHELAGFDCTGQSHPGRVTIRRLNRQEYNNTVRDLFGLQLDVADDFPSDDVGYGFDNIADVLSMPPILLEKYLEAAETIAAEVFQDDQAKKRVIAEEPESDEDIIRVARANVRQFATRAFRRPITAAEEDRLFDLMRLAFMQGSSPEEIYQLVTTAVLSNPNFLFRIEEDPEPGAKDNVRQLNGYELATRLSYFLWSSMPDDRLFELAESGELQKDDVLKAEVDRMLDDPKAVALVNNFAGQWLQLRDVDRLTPNPEQFPTFDDALKTAMRRETELFFENVIREDRSVLEFLNADYTFVNPRLADHYGIEGVSGEDFVRVSLPATRRGILTHASILTLTSNPTRTSPVKRGKWILDNVLAEPPPPPPPDVPELEEAGETFGTLREQMEQHRANPSCAACHRTMDALGFGLENFDAIGTFRREDGSNLIDASGELPGGKSFDGATQLMQILADEKKDRFCRCLAEKMLVYALGRGLQSYDRCVVQDTVAKLEANDHRFSALIKSIVLSDPFRKREGKSEQ